MAVIGLAAGTLAMAAAMFFANMVITPKFTGMPLEAIMDLMPLILLFNIVKAGINSIVTFILYKRGINSIFPKRKDRIIQML